MSEFSGLRKHEKTQHVLVGLGSAALAIAVTFLIQVGRPEFPERDNKVCKKKKSLAVTLGARKRGHITVQ